MKELRLFRILSVLLVLSLPMMAVTPAFADTHVLWVWPIDDTRLMWGGDTPCGPLYRHVWGNLRINGWLDENGELTHEIDIWGSLRMTITNPANGKSVAGNIQGPEKYFYTEDGFLYFGSGTASLITIPGYGKVWGGAGLAIEVWKFNPVTGEYELDSGEYHGHFNSDDWDDLCEYLGF